MTAAPTGLLLGALSSTFEIRADRSLRVPEHHRALLRRAIGKVSSYDRMIPVTVNMDETIGESPLVRVREGDRLYWAIPEGARNRPEEWIRVVGNRAAEPTSIVGLQMNYERLQGSDDYPYDGRLVAYSIGPFPLPVPRREFVDPNYTRSLIKFWREHAWAASSLCDRMINSRDACPWGIEW